MVSGRQLRYCAAAFALALAAASPTRADNVRSVREGLLTDSERRVASGMTPEEAWAKTRQRGIDAERGSPRRVFVDEVMRGIDRDVREGRIPVRDGEKPVIRTGAEPTQSRGQFSDEDFECFDPRCVGRFRDEAHRRKLPVKHDRLSMQIEEHDILVWKPQAKPPPPRQLGAAWDHALAATTNREFAPSAKPGAPARPMDAVLDHLNKGFDGLGRPPSEWGGSYEALERHTVTTKDVLRSFEQTGLCESRPADCAWLRERRSMSSPPPATDAERRALFVKEQRQLRSFMRDAFESAERSLRGEARALERALAKPGLDPARRLELRNEAAELRDTMRRMFSRFDALHAQNPELVTFVSGSRERSRFLAGLQDEIQQLDRNARTGKPSATVRVEAEQARQTAARLRTYTVVLTAAQLTQCMSEGRTAKQCAIEALEAAAQGLAESGAVMALSLVTPTGAVIASTLLAVKGGVYTVVATSIAVKEATLEGFRAASALAEEHRANQTLSAAQQANADRYQEQYARELAVFQQTSQRIAAARQAQRERLEVLVEVYRDFRQDLAGLRETLATQEARLAGLRGSYAALAERCQLFGLLERRASALAEQAANADQERAGRLAEARAALTACASAEALAEPERILARDTAERSALAARFSDARDLRKQIGASLKDLEADVGQGGAGKTDLASEVAGVLEPLVGQAQTIAASRPYLEADFAAEVQGLNGWIEAQRAELQTRLAPFEAAFPPDLVEREPGFAVLRMHIQAIDPLAAADWAASWKEARALFPAGYPADAFTSVERVKTLSTQFRQADVEPCRASLSERLAQVDAELAGAEARVAASDERTSRDLARLHLPRERCIARLGAATPGSGGTGEEDEARRRRLSRIQGAQNTPAETSDYHSPEARRQRELEEARRREEERRRERARVERERAWREGMEAAGRALETSLGPPPADLDPASSESSSRSVPETSPAASNRSQCASHPEFEACALMGEREACGLYPGGQPYSGPEYSCEQYCRCHVTEPR